MGDRQSDTHSGGQKDIHTYTVTETFRRTDMRHTVRHTFRLTEGQTYTYSQRNIQANRWETYSRAHIQAYRRTDIHIQSEKHSSGQI